MRIELNAGGIAGMITIASFQVDMEKTSSKIDDMISTFKAVKKSVYNINGGVGNLQEAVDNLQERIRNEEIKKESVTQIRKETNDFLALAIKVDNQVSSLIDRNQEEFYELNPWLRPPKDDTVLDKIVNAIDEFVDSAADFLEEVADVLVDWYENCGGKEILNILESLLFEALAVAGFILSVLALTPPLTPLGIAGLCLSGTALVINTVNTGWDIGNEINAYNRKQQALGAEASGDYELARQLREDAAAFSDESSLYDRWWNDGEFNGWDILGGIMFGVEIADLAVSIGSFIDNIDDIAKAGSFTKWAGEGMDAVSNVSGFVIDAINLEIGTNSILGTSETLGNSIAKNIDIDAIRDISIDIAIESVDIVSNIIEPINITFVPVEIFVPVVSFD